MSRTRRFARDPKNAGQINFNLPLETPCCFQQRLSMLLRQPIADPSKLDIGRISTAWR